MKNYSRSITGRIAIILLFSSLIISCKKNHPDKDSFTFIFMTDIHLQQEMNAVKGFRQAILKVNELKPDFVITGGDLVMDALGQSYGRADSLYNLYKESIEIFGMPVYNTMGNHEIFGLYESSGIDSTHEFYGEKLFENRIGKKYYAFDHKGWRFYILDSVDELEEGGYFGHISEEQLAWLKEDLAGINPETPIAISVHIPFITVQTQINQGSTVPNSQGIVITNSKEVLDIFSGYNLKLVLQGHLHALEDIFVNGIHFITGGAVCANWWKGPRREMEEGFLYIKVKGEQIKSEYIDFGWEVTE